MVLRSVFLFLLCLSAFALRTAGSTRATYRPVFPTMDYTLTKISDSTTRIVFHTTYQAAAPDGSIPFLGYTIDTTGTGLRIVAWFDIRDARKGVPVRRDDTVFYKAGEIDSIRLVSATIYRDSMEYAFSRNDWNVSDSLYFFSKKGDSAAPPLTGMLRAKPVSNRREVRIENPEAIPVTGLELLTAKGALVRKMKGNTRLFSTSGLRAGIYFLRLRSPYGNQVEIVIVSG